MAGAARDALRRARMRRNISQIRSSSVRKWRRSQMEAMWETATWSRARRTGCGEEAFRGIWWPSLGSWEERHTDPRGKYCTHASPAAEASEDLMSFKRNGDAWVEMGLGRRGEGHSERTLRCYMYLSYLHSCWSILPTAWTCICLVDTLDNIFNWRSWPRNTKFPYTTVQIQHKKRRAQSKHTRGCSLWLKVMAKARHQWQGKGERKIIAWSNFLIESPSEKWDLVNKLREDRRTKAQYLKS